MPENPRISFEAPEVQQRALIKKTELNHEWQQMAVDTYAIASQKFMDNKEIAAFIKKEFDSKYTGVWNCVIGKDFGW
ncbi:unnamed protein product [Echinostoma caproni]|uniref:Dynein light chain n=1 Tax=Echinostoma caproni TaxID=27848 RepID=A0A183AAR3_9TREM|nr:unnamed protein product [Echinostoma caproni]